MMFESIINSSELEIPCKFVLRTEFIFYLVDDNHIWEPLKRYQSPDRKVIEDHYEKLNNLLKNKTVLKINNKDYPTERLYTSKIEQQFEYKLFVKNQDVPLHRCVNVIMNKIVEDGLTSNEIKCCTLSKMFDVCDSTHERNYFDEETLIYDSNKNNSYYL